MSTLVVEARQVNNRLRAYSLLNLADPQGSDNVDANEALTMIAGIDTLPFMIVRRKAFPRA
jgi:chromosome partitioning protein